MFYTQNWRHTQYSVTQSTACGSTYMHSINLKEFTTNLTTKDFTKVFPKVTTESKSLPETRIFIVQLVTFRSLLSIASLHMLKTLNYFYLRLWRQNKIITIKHDPMYSGAIPRGGHLGLVPPPLEPNAQRKNLRRLKDLRGQIQQKSPKFSKWIFFLLKTFS